MTAEGVAIYDRSGLTKKILDLCRYQIVTDHCKQNKLELSDFELKFLPSVNVLNASEWLL